MAQALFSLSLSLGSMCLYNVLHTKGTFLPCRQRDTQKKRRRTSDVLSLVTCTLSTFASFNYFHLCTHTRTSSPLLFSLTFYPRNPNSNQTAGFIKKLRTYLYIIQSIFHSLWLCPPVFRFLSTDEFHNVVLFVEYICSLSFLLV